MQTNSSTKLRIKLKYLYILPLSFGLETEQDEEVMHCVSESLYINIIEKLIRRSSIEPISAFRSFYLAINRSSVGGNLNSKLGWRESNVSSAGVCT